MTGGSAGTFRNQGGNGRRRSPPTPTTTRKKRKGFYPFQDRFVVGVVLVTFLLLALPNNNNNNGWVQGQTDENEEAIASPPQKIAVIGGAITGSFVTKYLIDYDIHCELESITVFEPYPYKGPISVLTTTPDDNWQGSRVQSAILSDNKTIVELGASIGFKDFHLVMELIQKDATYGGEPVLTIGPPFNTGNSEEEDTTTTLAEMRKGMGIYNGNGKWSLLPTTLKSNFLKKLIVLWRYERDLFKVSKITKFMTTNFANVPTLLQSTNEDTFFSSPEEIWKLIQLDHYIHISFDQLLDELHVSKKQRNSPFWNIKLPYQGYLRDELLTAINLVNYNQNNEQINSVVGLGSFAASSGGLFSIIGGNNKIITSALNQAIYNSHKQCGTTKKKSQIQEVTQKITKVVALEKENQFQLYSSSDDLVGTYDIVIVATPIQQSRIEFLVETTDTSPNKQDDDDDDDDDDIKNHLPMEMLGGVPHASNRRNDNRPSHNGLMESAIRPYTQVVTTVISNASISYTTFGIPKESNLPRSILMTEEGKQNLYNITAITQLKSYNMPNKSTTVSTYKMFSNDKLSKEILKELFGPYYVVEYVKFWGGPHGGATPDYQGEGNAQSFLLYDTNNHSKNGAGGLLYYPSAMEQSSLACMELSAIGAKAVSKLIAHRLGFIQKTSQKDTHDKDTDGDSDNKKNEL